MLDSTIMVTTRQAAELLDVHESSIKRWCSLDQLTCNQTPGGHRRIPFDALMSFAQQKDISCPLHTFDHYAGWVWDGFMHAKKTGDFSPLAAIATEWIQQGGTQYLFDLLQYLGKQGHSLASQMDTIIAPVMYAVGQSYLDGALSIGEEHRNTYLMRDVLIRLSNPETVQKDPYKKVILGCIRSQEHELGCLMARLVLERAGWDVLYLGLDVPTEEFARMQTTYDATMVCIALMPPTTQSEVLHILELLDYMYDRKKPYHLVFGGPVELDLDSHKAAWNALTSVQHFMRMAAFGTWLQDLAEPAPYAISKDLDSNSLNRSLR